MLVEKVELLLMDLAEAECIHGMLELRAGHQVGASSVKPREGVLQAMLHRRFAAQLLQQRTAQLVLRRQRVMPATRGAGAHAAAATDLAIFSGGHSPPLAGLVLGCCCTPSCWCSAEAATLLSALTVLQLRMLGTVKYGISVPGYIPA